MSTGLNAKLSSERNQWNARFLAAYKQSLVGVSIASVCGYSFFAYLLRAHIHLEFNFETFLFFGGVVLATAAIAVPHALAQLPPYPTEEMLQRDTEFKAFYEQIRQNERAAAASQVNAPVSDLSSQEKS